jgi:arylsulfatase
MKQTDVQHPRRERQVGHALVLGVSILAASFAAPDAFAQDASPAGSKPNFLLIVSDDTGWGDLGPYLGGKAR